MTSFFDRLFTTYPIKSRRLIELSIGFLTWMIVLLPVWGSLLLPIFTAYFILFFDMYWFYKSYQLVRTSYIATNKIKKAEKIDWLERAQKFENMKKVHHFLIMPNYQETFEKLDETLNNLLKQTFPIKQIHIVLAMEQREEDGRKRANALIKKYVGKFGSIVATYHPDIPGEVKGKSSNESFAGREIHKKYFIEGTYDIDFATVSSVDADSMFDKQFFSYLTYKFLSDPLRYNKFWQSAVVFYNNIWKVPSPTRIISFFGSLYRTALLVQGDRLITQSTYSLSYKLLADIDFWDTDVIPEDYRVFFKAFYRMKGNIWVEPIFLKTSMDAALSKGYIRSLKNKYHQERRWSAGVSDDPLFIKWWLTVPNVPFWRKTSILAHVILDHLLWPVYWFIITVAASIMPIVNPTFYRTSLGYTLPSLGGFILTLTIAAIFALMYVDYKNRPENKYLPFRRKLLFPLEFLLMPIIGFFFGALPALISHTHLITGKRLEYKVTEKA